MDVAVRDIERNDAKARDAGEVVYDVIAVVDAHDRAFEVVVSLERIASAMVPCVTFRDPADANILDTISGRSSRYSGRLLTPTIARRR